MPWTRRQVRFLESKDSPLTSSQREKMNAELHANPAMGHMKKGHMSKVDTYKKSKRKAHRVVIEPAEGGYVATTHYPGPIDGSSHGTLINDEGPEKSVHKSLGSVHRHLNNVMGHSGPHKGE
jgi:hypothetical protein